ncbi:hypothetical protein [Pseudomonas sp. GW456-12-10-14-LB2]|uniref:hypothetical protein n=1 Tax=Pseudomonas sp. GW456-12-10-14-LB2 TaxID=2070674 RepID=UPI0021150A0B|nr:hypothetical protein [Pseudomonas sp. GW456-12-10-14-LB2]
MHGEDAISDSNLLAVFLCGYIFRFINLAEMAGGFICWSEKGGYLCYLNRSVPFLNKSVGKLVAALYWLLEGASVVNGFFITMKRSCFGFLALFPFAAHSAVTSESLCFELSETSPVKFEFHTFYDVSSKWSGGSSEPISIVLTDTQNEMLGADAPWQSTRSWSEVISGKVSGTYELVTQGTQVVSMTYTKKSNGKVYYFGNNTSVDSSLESGCKWE